jgi:integrase
MAAITTPNARKSLAPRGKPYFKDIIPGLRLGYRKNRQSAATWLAARYLGAGKYQFEPLGIADDLSVSAEAALNYDEAKAAALRWAKQAALSPAISLTVRTAVEEYGALRDKREQARLVGTVFRAKNDFRSKAQAVFASKLAGIQVNRLTKADLKDWRAGLNAGRERPLAVASVNRMCTDLKAALRQAIETHQLTLDPKVLTEGLRAARGETVENNRPPQVLSQGEVNAIVDAARELDAELGWNGDLHRLILVLAATGARFSQVKRLTVGDVDGQRIHVPVSHKGSGRKARTHNPMHAHQDVIEALRPVLNGRDSSDWLLERPTFDKAGAEIGRGPWQAADDLARPGRWGAILAKAGLKPHLLPYCLRHSSIVRWLSKRLPVKVVAVLHDTGTPMIERHYARYINDVMQDVMAASVEPMGGATVTPLLRVVA